MQKIFLASLLLILSSCTSKISSSATKTGVDFHGKVKACEPMGPKACTKILTEEDRYAMKCRAQGLEVVQCDCHDWICIQ